MKILRVHSATSNILRVHLRNSSTGAGLTGLTSASTGLIISSIADVEATATTYTVAASNVETITTLGTFAAPTSGKCRFKEVDATNHPGLYEVQIADARFAVASAKSLTVTLSGATNLLTKVIEIQLSQVNVDDAVRAGMTSLPNAAAAASGGLFTRGTGAGQINQDANGRIDVNTLAINGSTNAANIAKLWYDAHRTGTVASATTTSATLDSGAPALNNTENGKLLITLGGTGPGQVRPIEAYTSGRVATVYTWFTTPDATTTYLIAPHHWPAMDGSRRVDLMDNAVDSSSVASNAITSAKIASGAITSSTFASGAITNTAIAADAIGASELAADAVTEIQSGLATAANLATVAGYLDTEIAELLSRLPDTITGTVSGVITGNSFELSSLAPQSLAGWICVVATSAGTEARVIAAHVDNTTEISFNRNLTGTLSGGEAYSLYPADAAVTGTSQKVYLAAGTQTFNMTGNITGNLSGSVGSVTGAVGSVTGAVGSVTGNVGGNVTGSIGSLATQAKADVNTEVDGAIETYHLDHLIAAADPGGVVANSSFLAKLASKSATPAFSSFNNTTDSLEAIRDRGDAAWITGSGGGGGSGTGAYTITVTVNDGATALQNAIVRYTEGGNSYTATTNASGVATFNLDAATFTVAITKAGYSFAGTTHVVTATDSATYSMTQITITAPPLPDQATGALTTRNANGTAEADVIVHFRMTAGPGTAGYAFPGRIFTGESDANGLLEEVFVRGATYEGSRDGGTWVEFTVPDASTFTLPEVLGFSENMP